MKHVKCKANPWRHLTSQQPWTITVVRNNLGSTLPILPLQPVLMIQSRVCTLQVLGFNKFGSCCSKCVVRGTTICVGLAPVMAAEQARPGAS